MTLTRFPRPCPIPGHPQDGGPAPLAADSAWSRLRAWGGSVAKRRGMKRGTVAVARPAVIMHRSSVTGDEFDFGGPAVAAMAA